MFARLKKIALHQNVHIFFSGPISLIFILKKCVPRENLFSIKRCLLFRKMLLLQSKLVILKDVRVLRLKWLIQPFAIQIWNNISKISNTKLFVSSTDEYYFWFPARARCWCTQKWEHKIKEHEDTNESQELQSTFSY